MPKITKIIPNITRADFFALLELFAVFDEGAGAGAMGCDGEAWAG